MDSEKLYIRHLFIMLSYIKVRFPWRLRSRDAKQKQESGTVIG